MEQKKMNRVEFEYKILPSYNVYSISGVHGGLNASGEVVANFFHERARIPKKEAFDISEDGKLVPDPNALQTDNSFIRNVLFSVSMNPNTARSIGQWLINRADDHQKILGHQIETKK